MPLKSSAYEYRNYGSFFNIWHNGKDTFRIYPFGKIHSFTDRGEYFSPPCAAPKKTWC